MRYKATVNDDGLKNGLAVSAGLHLMLFLFVFFGLPHLIPPLPTHHDPVPFEIVTLAEMTNTRVDQKPDEPKPPAPAPQPQAKPQPAPPTPPQTQQQPPAPKMPDPIKPVEAEALKPKPIDKPKPVDKPAPQQDLLSSVLKDVAKLKPTPPAPTPDAKSDVKTLAPPVASQAPSLSTRLTISDEDALRRQIEQCWNPPIGARDAQTLIVELWIDVNPDRTVASTDIVDKARYNTDSFFRAAADSAVRAVRSPRCSPLILPEDKYDQWKRIDFTFDPRDLL